MLLNLCEFLAASFAGLPDNSLAIVFLLLAPWEVLFVLYINGVYVAIVYFWGFLKNAKMNDEFWLPVRRNVCRFFKYYNKIFHGHEIVGFEKLPTNSKALIIGFHGNTVNDVQSLYSDYFLSTNRIIRLVIDKVWFRLPFLKFPLDMFGCSPGSIESCVRTLNEGNLLLILPGGMKEGILSYESYQVIWGERKGFARIAVEAKAPIIPMFTVNSRQALYFFPFFKDFFWRHCDSTRLPLMIAFGNFPVKLVTYLGEPIEYDPNRTVEELRDLTRQRIEEMIRKHQKLPKSIWEAFKDRFRSIKKID